MKEIGEELGISEAGAKTHARAICAALGSRNLAHAVALAYQRKILLVDEEEEEE